MGQTEEDKLLNEVTGKSYEFGFTTDIESDTIAPGLNEDVIGSATHVIFSQPALKEFGAGKSTEEALNYALELNCGWVGVTEGSSGTRWLDKGVLRHFPAFNVNTVDTLGAGDVFHGIFTLCLAEGNTEENSLVGLVFGILSSVGFSIFSVTLRWRKETPKFTTVAFAGLFCFVFATLMILFKGQGFFSTSYNSSLFSLHGTLVCFGLILYSIGSKAIPAAELTLLSLTEIIGGIFWVWLPLFGINEIPSTNTIIGGFFLFISLTYYSLVMRWNKRYIGLN